MPRHLPAATSSGEKIAGYSKSAMVVLLLTLGAFQGRVDGRAFRTSDLGHIAWYGPELERLHRLGIVEEVTQPKSFLGLSLWNKTYWRLTSRGFVWWMTRHVIAESRDAVDWTQWLRDKEYQGLLTREQAERVCAMTKALPPAADMLKLLRDIFPDAG